MAHQKPQPDDSDFDDINKILDLLGAADLGPQTTPQPRPAKVPPTTPRPAKVPPTTPRPAKVPPTIPQPTTAPTRPGAPSRPEPPPQMPPPRLEPATPTPAAALPVSDSVAITTLPLEQRTDIAKAVEDDNIVRRLVESTITNFDVVGNEVINSWRSDREEIQRVIDYLSAIVIADGQSTAVHLESLIKALEVKGNMSLTAVKALDAKTKLLAALRGGSIVNINNQQNAIAAPGELERVLSEPLDSDFAKE